MSDDYTWRFRAEGGQEATGLFRILQKLDQTLQRLTQRDAELRRTLQDMAKGSRDAAGAARQNADATDRTATSHKTLFQTLTHAAGIWNTWNKAVDFAVKRLNQLYTGFTALFSKVQDIGGAFERSRATMETLASSAGSDANEIAKLTAKTKELGRTTEFTARNAADGAITLLKAGETASSAYDKLGVALDGAAATGLEIDKVAAIGNHALKIFGQNLGQVGNRTMNYDTALRVMIASANAADVTVSELDRSLTKGGDILARLGIPLTRVNAALGLMANKGFTGSTAMRQLSIGVKRLVDGTAPAKKALETLGIQAVDDQGNFRDLGQVMQEINTALDLRPMNEQTKLMKDLFGAADKSMGALLDAGVAGFDNLEQSILRNLDVMDQLKASRTATMVGSWKQFQSAVEGVYIELTDVLSVPIQEFWNTLANILNLVSDRILIVGKRMQESGGGIESWIDAIKSGSFEGIFEGLSDDLKPQIDKLKTLFKGMVDAVIQLFKQGLASAAKEIWNSIFTEDVTSKAVEMGTTVGKEILAGLLSTNIGKLLAASFAMNFASGTIPVIQHIAGMVSKLSSMVGLGGAGASMAGLAGTAVTGTAAIAAGVGVGAAAIGVGGMMAATHYYNKDAQKEDQRGVQILQDHLAKMLEVKKELTAIPLIDRSEDDEAKLQRVNEQIAQTGQQLSDLGGLGPKGDAVAVYYADQTKKAIQELDALKKKQDEVTQEVKKTTNLTPEEMAMRNTYQEFRRTTGSTAGLDEFQQTEDYVLWQRAQAQKAENQRRQALEAQRQSQVQNIMQGTPGMTQADAEQQYRVNQAMERAQRGRPQQGTVLADMSETEIQAKQTLLSKQDELTAAEEKYKEAIEASNEAFTKSQVEINNVGAAFEKWMLNPVNVFTQKILGIKEQFSGIVDSLRGKTINLEEKFGLKTSEQANTARMNLLKKSLTRDQRMFDLAQTPEEQQKIQERMAEKTAQMAELAPEGQQQQFARKAADLYGRAEDSAEKAADLREQEVEIERDAAEKNVEEYRKMYQSAQTSAGKAEWGALLRDTLMSLGGENKIEAKKMESEWEKARAEAAAEEAEKSSRIATATELSAELLRRAVDALESTAKATQDQFSLPPNQGYADLPV